MCVAAVVAVGCRWMSAKDTTKASTDSCSRFNFGFSMKVDQAEVDWRFAQPNTPTHTHHVRMYNVYKCIEAVVKC